MAADLVLPQSFDQPAVASAALLCQHHHMMATCLMTHQDAQLDAGFAVAGGVAAGVRVQGALERQKRLAGCRPAAAYYLAGLSPLTAAALEVLCWAIYVPALDGVLVLLSAVSTSSATTCR